VLISNALWHGEGTVTLTARQAAGSVAIDVSDEGPGMPGDPAQDAWSSPGGALCCAQRDMSDALPCPGTPPGPRAKVAGTRSPADDGHGRGLPLARSLASAAGGNLALSRPGPEPVFTVTFPVASDAAQPAPPASSKR
jgi:signal transduction histidine kinase